MSWKRPVRGVSSGLSLAVMLGPNLQLNENKLRREVGNGVDKSKEETLTAGGESAAQWEIVLGRYWRGT